MHARGRVAGQGGAGAAASSAAAAAAARCAVACGAEAIMGDDGDDGGFDRDAPGACDACQLAARAAARDRCAGLSAAPRTGAIFARRTEGTAAFAKDWLAALLDGSAPKSRRPQDVGRSAPALASASCSDVWCQRNEQKTARVAARPFAGRLGRVRFTGVGCRGPRWLCCPSRRSYHDAGRDIPQRAWRGARNYLSRVCVSRGSQRDDGVATRCGAKRRRRARPGEIAVHE